MMQELGLAYDLVILVLLALAGGVVAKKLKQPLILGYLIIGLLFSFVPIKFFEWHNLKVIADIGVAFLMFTLGLEFSFDAFKKIKNIVLWGGLGQVILTMVLFLIVLPFLGFAFEDSFYLAAAFSLSSTAVVVKILSDRGELLTLPGQIMIGWLLIQDLAVLPMMILIPSFARAETAGWGQVLPSLGRSIIILYIVLLLAKRVVPWLIDKITAFNSREVLLLFVVSLSLIAAFFTYSLGMSFAIGAFIAGLMVSTTVESHAVFAEIRPLRDLFITVFFLILAINAQPAMWLSHWGIILGLTLLVIMVKMILIFSLTLYFGYHSKVAFLVGIGLVQVGEFGFILAQEGVRSNLISDYGYSIIVAVTLLTIILTPILFNTASTIYDSLSASFRRYLPKIALFIFSDYKDERFGRELPIKDHVVICGYGRMGRYIGRALQLNKIPFVVIDYNRQVINQLMQASVPVVYGDPASKEVLDFAQVDFAKVLIIAIPDLQTQSQVIINAKALNPKIKILCRVHREADQPKLRALGADIIVQPEFEAGVYTVTKLAALFNFKDKVNKDIHRLRIEHGIVRE